MAVTPRQRTLGTKIWKKIMHPPKPTKKTEKEIKIEQSIVTGEIGRYQKY